MGPWVKCLSQNMKTRTQIPSTQSMSAQSLGGRDEIPEARWPARLAESASSDSKYKVGNNQGRPWMSTSVLHVNTCTYMHAHTWEHAFIHAHTTYKPKNNCASAHTDLDRNIQNSCVHKYPTQEQEAKPASVGHLLWQLCASEVTRSTCLTGQKEWIRIMPHCSNKSETEELTTFSWSLGMTKLTFGGRDHMTSVSCTSGAKDTASKKGTKESPRVADPARVNSYMAWV